MKQTHVLTSLLVCAVWVPSCATVKGNLTQDGTLKARLLESEGVRISQLDAFEDDKGLIVSGAVKPTSAGHPMVFGHVDLAVVDASGTTLATSSSEIEPRFSYRLRESYFRVVLDVRTPLDGTVIAAYHPDRRDVGIRQFSCKDNQAMGRAAR
jgi:hypothetical protein